MLWWIFQSIEIKNATQPPPKSHSADLHPLLDYLTTLVTWLFMDIVGIWQNLEKTEFYAEYLFFETFEGFTMTYSKRESWGFLPFLAYSWFFLILLVRLIGFLEFLGTILQILGCLGNTFYQEYPRFLSRVATVFTLGKDINFQKLR